MKSILILSCLIAASFSQTTTCTSTQMLYNNICFETSCFDTYIARFGSVSKANENDGKGDMPITFEPFMQFIDGNVEIQIQFVDTKDDGTMKRDNTKSCIESTLYKYADNTYSNGQALTDTITSAFDSVNNRRKWTFIITGENLKDYLIQDKSLVQSDPDHLSFEGFFGYDFTVAGHIQARFNFQIQLKVSNDLRGEAISSDISYIQKSGKGICTSGKGEKTEICITEADAEITFCEDDECVKTLEKGEKKQFYLNQNVLLKHSITTDGFQTYYLYPLSVTFSATGLQRTFRDLKSTIQKEGSTVVKIPINFTYTGVEMSIQSELRTTSGRRILQKSRLLESTSTGVTATTSAGNIGCIAADKNSGCPTCNDMCKYGSVDPSYNCSCSNGYILIAGLALILMAFI